MRAAGRRVIRRLGWVLAWLAVLFLMFLAVAGILAALGMWRG